jgi:hypothetical protein
VTGSNSSANECSGCGREHGRAWYGMVGSAEGLGQLHILERVFTGGVW